MKKWPYKGFNNVTYEQFALLYDFVTNTTGILYSTTNYIPNYKIYLIIANEVHELEWANWVKPLITISKDSQNGIYEFTRLGNAMIQKLTEIRNDSMVYC
jgi:hypothetical protein